jgi:hypothetical protein
LVKSFFKERSTRHLERTVKPSRNEQSSSIPSVIRSIEFFVKSENVRGKYSGNTGKEVQKSSEELLSRRKHLSDALPTKYQDNPALKEVLKLDSRIDHAARMLKHSKHKQNRYYKEMDYFREEHASIFGKKGEKFDQGSKKVSSAEFLKLYQDAVAGGVSSDPGVERAKLINKSKEIAEESSRDVYDNHRDAAQFVKDWQGELESRKEAYSQAKRALSDDQTKALRNARKKVGKKVEFVEDRKAAMRKSELDEELKAIRVQLDTGLAEARRLLSGVS